MVERRYRLNDAGKELNRMAHDLADSYPWVAFVISGIVFLAIGLLVMALLTNTGHS